MLQVSMKASCARDRSASIRAPLLHAGTKPVNADSGIANCGLNHVLMELDPFGTG